LFLIKTQGEVMSNLGPNGASTGARRLADLGVLLKGNRCSENVSQPQSHRFATSSRCVNGEPIDEANSERIREQAGRIAK